MNFEDAMIKCQSDGGFIASILSEKDQEHLKELLKATSDVGTVYIGINDREEEDVWQWVDGSPYGFKNWNVGEPNDWDSDEDCTHTNGGGWNDIACSSEENFVCKLYEPRRGQTSLQLNIKTEGSSFPSFPVWYRYNR